MNKDSIPHNLDQLGKMNEKLMQDLEIISEGRQKFYYYTQRSTARKILNGAPETNIKPHFRISSLAKMNDEQECSWHEQEKSSVYALCFSYTDSESIPMWYLYSGISGEGIRIGITSLKMKELIKKISVVYPIFNGEIDNNHPLYLNEDFALEYGWVYYLGHKNINYKSFTYERQKVDDEKAIEKFKRKNFFVKDYEWNYEKEFRIVFKLNRTVFAKYPEQIALFFDKDEMMKRGGGLSAMMAPELKNVKCQVIAQELGLPEHKISESKLKIRMNLISRNRNSIVEYFGEIVDGINDNRKLIQMKKAIDKQRMQLEENTTAGVY